jgi:solute:Na+ symporter, SSS family
MSGAAWAWALLAVYGITLIALAPTARDASGFYAGTDRRGRPPGTFWLFSTIFIAWIFAKSVTNAANLGASFGLPGAVAYAAYWLSIPVAGLVIVAIRNRHGAVSLPAWLTSRYGRAAAATFVFAILIRLYNEVWSNTAVVGAYFGPSGSAAWYAGAFGFTVLTLAYTLKGGLRTSIWTDAIQAGVFAAFLVLVLALALPRAGSGELTAVMTAGSWTLVGGVDLLLVALLQSLSYPFHDPVLTDRGFLSDTRTTLRSYFLAGAAGAVAITLFGLIGVTAFVSGMPVQGDAPRAVAASLGTLVLVVVTIIMMTSAGSTLDSAFSSVSKATSLDIPGVAGWKPRGVTAGRIAMVAAALLGSLPLLAGASILQATTISGTMVLGLAPAFILGIFLRAPAMAFHLAFWTGIAAGIAEVAGIVPSWMVIGDGRYGTLLGVNVWGLAVSTGLYLLVWAVGNEGTEAFRARLRPQVTQARGRPVRYQSRWRTPWQRGRK